MLPIRVFLAGRGSGRSFGRCDPEHDLDVVVIDFNAAHKNADDFLHADAIETVETIGDLGREVLQTADHEGEVTLGLDSVKRGPMPLLELGQALLQTRDARLELRLVDEAFRIAVD